MSPSVENIAGYAVGTQNISACVADVVAWIEQAQPDAPCRWLACLNPHSYAVALDDPPFAQALHAADWLIPDGSGIVLASKLLDGQIRERVTGSDIFRDVQMELNRLGGYRVFFLGSTEDTLVFARAVPSGPVAVVGITRATADQPMTVDVSTVGLTQGTVLHDALGGPDVTVGGGGSLTLSVPASGAVILAP